MWMRASRILSLDCRGAVSTMTRLLRRVRRAAWPPQFVQALETRASLRRSHRWSYVPYRSRAYYARPLARRHRIHHRHARRAHAILWADAQRSGTQPERLAGARAPDCPLGSSELTARLPFPARVVWRDGNLHGFQFVRPLYPAVVDTIAQRFEFRERTGPGAQRTG